MTLDPEQERQWNPRLHDEVNLALHELVNQGVDRREHALHVLLAELCEADRDHHQHHAGGSEAVELVGRIVDDWQRLERSDLELGQELFEHARSPVRRDGAQRHSSEPAAHEDGLVEFCPVAVFAEVVRTIGEIELLHRLTARRFLT